MKALISLTAALMLLSLIAPLHAQPTPTLWILVVIPNKLVRIYAEGFSGCCGKLVATTLYMTAWLSNTTGIEMIYTVHAVGGYIIGTDVDISFLPPGVYDCWITDPSFGDSNHVSLTVLSQ